MIRFVAFFFVCTTAALITIVVWLSAPHLTRAEPVQVAQDIVFPIKIFVGTKAWVSAKGTLSGDWMAYKNNTFSILCVPDECIVASVNQIGFGQVGEIEGPMTYPVTHWTEDDDVVAEGESLCSRITITLDRGTKTAFWVETPINQAALACKYADSNVRKATLETPRFWR